MKHVVSVHDEDKTFKYQVFDYSCDMKKHLISVYGKIKPFKCEFCDGSYTQKSKLKDHVLKSHSEKVPGPIGSGHFLP